MKWDTGVKLCDEVAKATKMAVVAGFPHLTCLGAIWVALATSADSTIARPWWTAQLQLPQSQVSVDFKSVLLRDRFKEW